jgi:NlpC/P60 family putative phage cell wall peptidase
MSQHREWILSETHSWLDTPYQHQASLKGAGTDCLGLIRGVYRAVYGAEPIFPPPYTPDWAERNGEEKLLQAAQEWLEEIPIAYTQPGDVVMFRMLPDAPCKHVAILTAPNIITHAYWGRAVVQSHMVPYWRKRWVHSFAFPKIQKSAL